MLSFLQNELLLNAASDNIDHKPSSTRAKSSIHGTSISFFQHPTSEVTGPNHFKLEKDVNNFPNLTLPKSYTDIVPLISGQSKHPVSNLPLQTSRIATRIEARAREWINALIDIEQDANLPITKEVSFSCVSFSNVQNIKTLQRYISSYAFVEQVNQFTSYGHSLFQSDFQSS